MPQMFKAKVRKVGTSFGVLIPLEVARQEHLREGDEVSIGVLREARLKLIDMAFGSAKGTKPYRRDRVDRLAR